MTDYTKCFDGGFIRRPPKFKPGDMVYSNEKFMVESSEWNSINNETIYCIVNERGARFNRKESELMGYHSVIADRYRYAHQIEQLQYRSMLNSVYGIKIADLMGVKKVIFNAPATIVLWNDGTKTVVKCSENDTFDPEKGLAFCFLKKLLGNNYYKTIRSEVSKYDEETLTDIESTSIVTSTLKSIANNLKTDLTNGGMFP